MRKKLSIILALVLILVFTLTGCGKTANTPAATGSEPPVANSETPGSGSTELKGKIPFGHGIQTLTLL